MTTEEAIKYHKMNYQTFVDALWDGNEEGNPFDEAFRMAIEALECVNSSAFKDGYKKGMADAMKVYEGKE